ncbi:MAG TPA: ABC transporter substrate-binding protein [Candidatus Aquicultoraceae bacterium]|nr:ABC transporter substrate-binding protein [Candidatus Aquicultoraceae bacterium]
MRKPIRNALRKALPGIALFLCLGCRPGAEGATAGSPVKLSLAVYPGPYSALIAVADRKGYFRDEGLDVSIRLHPSGKEALKAVTRGEAQAATVADFAFSAQVLAEPSVRILASIATTVGCQVVARRDRNIRIPSDLKGKRIGYTPDTVSGYFLYVFLLTEGIRHTDIRAVAVPAASQVEAVVSGDVDAVSAFEVYAFEAMKRLGEKGVSWNSQNNVAFHWLLASSESAVRSPEPLKRLLAALLKAEISVRTDEEEAMRIVAEEWKFDPAFLRQSWPDNRFDVSLSQSLVTSLQTYSRWEMRSKGRSGIPPDVLSWLHPGILEEVAPIKVTLFR